MTEPTFEVEKITPSIAKRYLAANRANRPVSASIVRSYVDAMRRGEWLMNAEAVKFDRDGRLVDGQHRLVAVESSGVPVQMLVARGLDPAVFKTLDTGHKRTASDVLAIRGIANSMAVAGALRLLHRTIADSIGSNKRITNTQLDALIDAHPGFLALADEAVHAPIYSPFLNAGPQMFAFYMAVNVDAVRARHFFRAVAGRIEVGAPPCPQAQKLRERLASVMEEIVTPAPKVRLAWYILAWNATLAGKPVPHFSRTLTDMPEWEPMPRFPVRAR